MEVHVESLLRWWDRVGTIVTVVQIRIVGIHLVGMDVVNSPIGTVEMALRIEMVVQVEEVETALQIGTVVTVVQIRKAVVVVAGGQHW
jgi:hypothetical protein